jgi:hypothetical protein
MTDIGDLIERLRRVEALHARTDVVGERNAAANALHAIREQLSQCEKQDPPIEFKFSLQDDWSRQLFSALLRRYGIEPYRYRGQRYTTVMARASKSFIDQTLWPEYVELDDILKSYLNDVTQRVINDAIFQDSSEPSEREKPAGIEDKRKAK